jgi:predicted anti-sigma-YlaC factor YlaD
MNNHRMTCRELVALVTEYVEGALSPADGARFDAHLQRCRGCRAYIDQLRTTIKLLGRLDEGDLPPPHRDALLAAFHDFRKRVAD